MKWKLRMVALVGCSESHGNQPMQPMHGKWQRLDQNLGLTECRLIVASLQLSFLDRKAWGTRCTFSQESSPLPPENVSMLVTLRAKGVGNPLDIYSGMNDPQLARQSKEVQSRRGVCQISLSFILPLLKQLPLIKCSFSARHYANSFRIMSLQHLYYHLKWFLRAREMGSLAHGYKISVSVMAIKQNTPQIRDLK